MDEKRSKHRSERNSCHHERLEHAEHPRQNLRRRGALEQRLSRHVEQRVRRARESEQEQRTCGGRPHRHDHERGRPDGERDDDRRHQPGPPDERCRDADAKCAAGTERRIEVAGATVAHAERADREHDVEDIEHPERDLLRSEQPDQGTCSGFADDDGEPLNQLCPDARATGRVRRWACDAADEQRRDSDGRAHNEEHPARAGDGEQHAGDGGRDKDADALVPAGDDVRGGQLLGPAAEGGRECSHRRAGHRHRGCRHGGAPVRQGRRAVEQEHSGGSAHAQSLRDVAECQDPGGAVAIAENRGERREQCRGHELNQCDDSCGGRTPVAVGVHEHRDPHGPLGSVEQREREFHPAKLRVANDDRADATDLADVLLHELRCQDGATARLRSSVSTVG